jgi:hypothetical protein
MGPCWSRIGVFGEGGRVVTARRDLRSNSLTGADVKGLASGNVTNGGLLAEDFAVGPFAMSLAVRTGPTVRPVGNQLEPFCNGTRFRYVFR